MDTEETSTSDAGRAWYDGKVYKSLLAAFSILRWVIVAIVFGFGVYIYQRDVNAQQTVSTVDLQREQVSLRKTMDDRTAARDKQMEKMLTREVYEAYHSADVQRMERMEKLLEQIMEHQSRP